jgi:hypothetical protein
VVELKGETFTGKVIAWSIKNIQRMLIYIAINIALFVISLILIVNIFRIYFALIIPIFFFLASGYLSMTYKIAKGYHKIITSMGPDLLGVKIISRGVMKITSLNLGEFYLMYHFGNDYENAYFRVWIVLDKPYSHTKGNKMLLWRKHSQNIRHFIGPPRVHPAVPTELIAQIKTLLKITLERHNNKYLIVAKMTTRSLSPKAYDVFRTVEVLEHIWAEL